MGNHRKPVCTQSEHLAMEITTTHHLMRSGIIWTGENQMDYRWRCSIQFECSIHLLGLHVQARELVVNIGEYESCTLSQ